MFLFFRKLSSVHCSLNEYTWEGKSKERKGFLGSDWRCKMQ